MAEQKRIRSANFTKEEKLILLYIIKKYKHIIENKETGGVYWRKKEEAWKQIEQEFNAQATTSRSIEVLKRFFNNTKKETRKYAAETKAATTATGGGSASLVKDDPIFNLTMDIINKKSVYGLESKFDDDSNLHMEDNKNVPASQSVCSDGEDIFIYLKSNDEDMQDIIPTPGLAATTTNVPSVTSHTVLETPTASSSKQQHNAPTPGRSTGWERRRRPPQSQTENLSLRYEEVASKKIEVLDMQLQLLRAEVEGQKEKNEWEREQRRLKAAREQEEHDLKKQLLLLDAHIKKAQLKALNKE